MKMRGHLEGSLGRIIATSELFKSVSVIDYGRRGQHVHLQKNEWRLVDIDSMVSSFVRVITLSLEEFTKISLHKGKMYSPNKIIGLRAISLAEPKRGFALPIFIFSNALYGTMLPWCEFVPQNMESVTSTFFFCCNKLVGGTSSLLAFAPPP